MPVRGINLPKRIPDKMDIASLKIFSLLCLAEQAYFGEEIASLKPKYY